MSTNLRFVLSGLFIVACWVAAFASAVLRNPLGRVAVLILVSVALTACGNGCVGSGADFDTCAANFATTPTAMP